MPAAPAARVAVENKPAVIHTSPGPDQTRAVEAVAPANVARARDRILERSRSARAPSKGRTTIRTRGPVPVSRPQRLSADQVAPRNVTPPAGITTSWKYTGSTAPTVVVENGDVAAS